MEELQQRTVEMPPAVKTSSLFRQRDKSLSKKLAHGEYQLKLYRPCSCNSGKKFAFCCKDKKMVVIDTNAGLENN